MNEWMTQEILKKYLNKKTLKKKKSVTEEVYMIKRKIFHTIE